MINQVATSSTVETMSSLEIAKLTGKNHADVMGDIRDMLVNLGNSEKGNLLSQFEGTYQGTRRAEKCYNLPRRETEILITGYDVVRRAKVIDRWMELEAKNRQPVPLPPNQSQLDCELLNSVNNLLQSGMSLSEAGLLAILGKQLPKPAKLPKPKKVKVEYNYINIRNLVPADKLPKVQKAMQQIRMLRSGPNSGQFVLDKGRADLLNARMPNGWGSLEVREDFTDTFLKLLQI